jgi:hypothetical protein
MNALTEFDDKKLRGTEPPGALMWMPLCETRDRELRLTRSEFWVDM